MPCTEVKPSMLLRNYNKLQNRNAVDFIFVEKQEKGYSTLHKKTSLFTLRISAVNVTKSTGNSGFGHIYWRNT